MRYARWLLVLFLSLAVWAQGPFFGGLPPKTKEKITQVAYFAYTVGYSERTRTPLWSAYFVETKDPPVPPHVVSRKGYPFLTEPRTEARVTSKDYNRSGFSRGHMTPFAAIAYAFGASVPGEVTQPGETGTNPAKQTFYLTNIVPQLQEHNAGIWSNLEEAISGVRTGHDFQPGLTQHSARIWVYTGPVFSRKGPVKTISAKGIQVPVALWKAAIWITPKGETRACAWIIPHEVNLDPHAFMDYATTLAEIRRQAQVTIIAEDAEGLMKRCDSKDIEEIIQ